MAIPEKELNKRYTYADYITWDDGKRYEIIDGVVYEMLFEESTSHGEIRGANGVAYAMSPAPRRRHQEVCGELYAELRNFLKEKPCKVYIAPFDVRLSTSENDDTVVQPDITVICDKSKLDEKGCDGVPDMIIEILSPLTSSYDKVLKFNKYLKTGVREYWIVSPDDKTVSVHLLDNGKYNVTPYGEEDMVPVNILEGCSINLKDVFSDD